MKTNTPLIKQFLKVTSAAGIAGALLAGCAQIPVTERPISQNIPPDHVPVRPAPTGVGTCSMPVMGIYTDFNTKVAEKRIIGGTNVLCGGWEPPIKETGFCFDTNVPRPSRGGFSYDRYGNITGERQDYERPRPGYCPTGEFYQYVIR